MRICKYEVQSHGEGTISVPRGAKILHVAEQSLRIYLWVEVPDSQFYEDIKIQAIYTNEPFTSAIPRKYIGTVLAPNGLVIHYYQF